MTVLWTNARIASLSGPEAWGWIAQGALISQAERLLWVGPAADLPAELLANVEQRHDLGGAVVTPGLIDCHTHLVYAGQRASEFEQRLQGVAYEDIARAGGGIRATVAATRAASEARLFELAARRLRYLLAEGVTTVEIKSGYGLNLATEAACLRVARRLRAELAVEVRSTFLGAHALPPEFTGRPDDYVSAVCDWMARLHADGLVDAVDAFCEGIGLRRHRRGESLKRPVPWACRSNCMPNSSVIKAVRNWLAVSALSCDHLEHLSAAGVQAMAAAGTVAVLLPGAYYFLRETQAPPVDALRAAGVPIAISTDHNPGTSPALSLLLMLNMACTLFRLTPEEALRGVTVNAARALGLHDRGQLVAGQRADFCVWDIEHPNELAYFFGRNPLRQVVRAGVIRP
ncbi:imidazolonepropionase [Roseateles sp. GG27B]